MNKKRCEKSLAGSLFVSSSSLSLFTSLQFLFLPFLIYFNNLINILHIRKEFNVTHHYKCGWKFNFFRLAEMSEFRASKSQQIHPADSFRHRGMLFSKYMVAIAVIGYPVAPIRDGSIECFQY